MTVWRTGAVPPALRPSGFEFTFHIDGRSLAYGFEVIVDTGRVESEWLYDTGSGDRPVFVREDGRIDAGGDPGSDPRMGILRELAGEDGLVLPLLARMSDDGGLIGQCRAVMTWFVERLRVIPARAFLPVPLDPGRDDLIGTKMREYRTGITDMGYERLDGMPPEIPPVLAEEAGRRLRAGETGFLRGPFGSLRLSYDDGLTVERAFFMHGGNRFDFHEESDGTRRLYDIMPVLEGGPGDGMTFVIDELDRSLHPKLVRRFVSDFLGSAASLGRQLVFTTHEVGLMDQNILRRDEIWFVDRDGAGNSRLHSLYEFRERGDKRIDRSYMDGRYGGVPEFGEAVGGYDEARDGSRQEESLKPVSGIIYRWNSPKTWGNKWGQPLHGMDEIP